MSTAYGCMARWKRRDIPGDEICRLIPSPGGWRVVGSARLEPDGGMCQLEYEIDCDGGWVTRSASVTGMVGDRAIDVRVVRSAGGEWVMNEIPVEAVGGCVDIDLNFSPSTNLLPIRRCPMEIDQPVSVRAAWLRFPGFTLEPLEQRYTRLGPGLYRYESAGGRFAAELSVDPVGLVIDYGDIWSRELSPGAGPTPR